MSDEASSSALLELVSDAERRPWRRSFLPGALLMTATLDLVSSETIAGASRLVAGALQLGLLTLRVVGGVGPAGVPAPSPRPLAEVLTSWTGWAGVALCALDVVLHLGATPGAAWFLLVMPSVWLGQLAGAALFGPILSGSPEHLWRCSCRTRRAPSAGATVDRHLPPALCLPMPGQWDLSALPTS